MLCETPRLTLIEDRVELPGGHQADWLRYEGLRSFVNVLCFDEEGRVLVARQYNHGAGCVVYEFPGGVIDEGETPEQAAQRELAEEAGLHAERLEPIGSYLPDPRRTSMRCYAFVATQLSPTPPRPEPEEVIVSEWLTPAELKAKLRSGVPVTTNVLSVWALYELR